MQENINRFKSLFRGAKTAHGTNFNNALTNFRFAPMLLAWRSCIKEALLPRALVGHTAILDGLKAKYDLYGNVLSKEEPLN